MRLGSRLGSMRQARVLQLLHDSRRDVYAAESTPNGLRSGKSVNLLGSADFVGNPREIGVDFRIFRID